MWSQTPPWSGGASEMNGNSRGNGAADRAAAEGRAQGLDTGWTVFSYLIGGMLAYGAVGWLNARAVHVPLLFPAGMLVGMAISIGYIIHRYGRQGAAARPPRKERTGDRGRWGARERWVPPVQRLRLPLARAAELRLQAAVQRRLVPFHQADADRGDLHAGGDRLLLGGVPQASADPARRAERW